MQTQPVGFRSISAQVSIGNKQRKVTVLSGHTNGVRIDCYTPTKPSNYPALAFFTGFMVRPVPIEQITPELLGDCDGALRYSNYLGSMPLELAAFIGVPVLVVYQPGVSGQYDAEYGTMKGRHSYEDGVLQLSAGLKTAQQLEICKNGIVPVSHSFASPTHLALIQDGLLLEEAQDANVKGGILACPFPQDPTLIFHGTREGRFIWSTLFRIAAKIPFLKYFIFPLNPVASPRLHVPGSKNPSWGLARWIEAFKTAIHFLHKSRMAELSNRGGKNVELQVIPDARHNLFVLPKNQRIALYKAIQHYLKELKKQPNKLLALAGEHDVLCTPPEVRRLVDALNKPRQ